MAITRPRPRALAALSACALALSACTASVTIGDKVEYLPALASNGDDFTLLWQTTDSEGNVVNNRLLTTLPGADLDAHFYALPEYGISRDLATACGYDESTDLLIDGYASSSATTLVTPVDNHLAFGFSADGPIDPVGATLVWFNVTEADDGTFPLTTQCIAMPNTDDGVFYFDSWQFTAQDAMVGFNFYLMLTDFSSLSANDQAAFLDSVAIEPDLESHYVDDTASITGGSLLLNGTYSGE